MINGQCNYFPMVVIVDYGVGNTRAFANSYKTLGVPFILAQNTAALAVATQIILPGVGAFDHAMDKLNSSGMRPLLDEMVLEKRIPVLGVCVGMQMLAQHSEEGKLPGLGWIDGTVKKFDVSKIQSTTRLPHMGWNDVLPGQPVNLLFDGLLADAKFYFLHSYYFVCNRVTDRIAVANYGGDFTCAVNHQHIYGVQFHPEKSHHCGMKLLENFSKVK